MKMGSNDYFNALSPLDNSSTYNGHNVYRP